MELGDLLMEFMRKGPTRHLARVDELPRETVKLGRLIQGGLEVVCGVSGGIAVVNKSSTQGSGNMAVLSFGPDAHQELYVVKGPRAALEVSICPGELLGVRSIHAYVAFVVVIEVAPDPDNIFWATRVKRETEADVSDEIVEALLPVKSSSREGESKGSRMLDAEGERRADITDRSFGNGPKAGGVSPPFAPGG